jgi:hypothetical protein
LEKEIALIGQRLDDLRGRVTDLAVQTATITRIEVTAAQLQSEVTNLRRDLNERDRDAAADRRSTRAAIWGMTAAIMTTIVGAVVTFVVAG